MQTLRTATRQVVSKSLELVAIGSLKECVEAVLSDTTSVALEVSKVFLANLTTELSQCVVNATDPAIDFNTVDPIHVSRVGAKRGCRCLAQELDHSQGLL